MAEVAVEAARAANPRSKSLKKTLQIAVIPLLPSTQVLLVQVANKRGQFLTAADFIIYTKLIAIT